MTSLRLAIQKSLQEAAEGSETPTRRIKKEKKRERLSSSNRPPRKPGDPPRKRGRPRKNPVSSSPMLESKSDGNEENGSSDEQEFDSGKEGASSSDDESGHDEQSNEDNGSTDDDNRSASSHRKKAKRNHAANKIQSHWKKKQKKPSKDDGDEGEEQKSNKPKSKKSASKSTVPSPGPELIEWIQGLTNKKQRRNVSPGLRVKVRFETKVRKRDGKIVRKPKWYGGLVTAVSTGGSKIRIKYDDGTSEITRFPDEDIVVDAEGNGRHRGSAKSFEVPKNEDEKNEGDLAEYTGDDDMNVRNAEPITEDHKTSMPGNRDAPLGEVEISTKKSTKKSSSSKRTESRVKHAEPGDNASDDSTEETPSQSSSMKKNPKLKIRLVPPKRKREATVDASRTHDTGDEGKSGDDEQDFGQTADAGVPGPAQHTPLGKKRNREENQSDAEEQPAKKAYVEAATMTSKSTTIAEADELDGLIDPMHDPGPAVAEVASENVVIHAVGAGTEATQLEDRAATIGTSILPASAAETIEGPEPPLEDVESRGLPDKPTTSRLKPSEAKSTESNELDEETEPASSSVVLSLGSLQSVEQTTGSSKKETSADETRETKVLTPVPLFSTLMDEPSSPVPRSGRRAAQQANERIAARQEIVIQDPYAKKKRKRDKSDTGEAKRKRPADDSGDDDDPSWVRCDKCLKWRVLPSSVQTEKLPKHWYCEMNIYDALRNSCDAPEQTPAEIEKERRKAKRKAARLARKQAEQVERVTSESDGLAKKGKKERIREVQNVRGPSNEKATLQLSQKGVVTMGVSRVLSGGSRSHSPQSDADVVSRNPGRKQTLSSTAKRSVKREEDEAELDVTADSGPTKGKGRGRPRGRASKDFSGKGGRSEKSVSQMNQDADNQEWVMCEKCSKWRRLPLHVSANSLPEVWYCSMNTWNPASASCQAVEDKADPNTVEFGIYGSGVSTAAGGNTLSYRNLIFGTAGKKQNRPVSERTRAAESLFAPPDDPSSEGGHPKAMYSNSSMYVPRGMKASADNDRVSLFDIMDHSKLWEELRNASIMKDALTKPMPALYRSRDIDSSFGSFSDDTKRIMKEIVYHSLGSGARAGHEVLLEAQCRPWKGAPTAWSQVRAYCTIHNVVESLLELASDGRVEIVQPKVGFLMSPLPKYRRIETHFGDKNSPTATLIAEPPRTSRCIKIAKPWKQGLSID